MSSYRKTGPLFLSVIAIVIASTGARLESKNERYVSENSQIKGQVDEEQWPLTDLETPSPADPEMRKKRLRRGEKFDKPKLNVEPNANFGQSITNDHWYLSITALPVAQSNVVVIGNIISSQAYLSNNKEGIYSEFGFQVEKVLKDDSHVITIGNRIDVEREGGRIRQPSGRITRYSIAGQNMPRVGKRYMLFLTCSNPEQAFDILTGYEFRAGKVFPLDEAGDMFDLYRGIDDVDFLSAVQDAIANPQ